MGLAGELGIKCVFTCDSHYCRKEDAGVHDVLLCISTKDTVKNDKRMTFGSEDFYMKTWPEIQEMLVSRGAGALVENTLEVASKVTGDIIKPSKALLPTFALPPGVESEEEYLKELIRNGMIRRGVYNKKAYRDRITEELGVITKCGFISYFLVLWDIIDNARRKGIRL